jgi:hypothetical protein
MTNIRTIDDIWLAGILNLRGANLREITFNDQLTKFSFQYEELTEELDELLDSLEISRGTATIRLYDLRDEIRRLSNMAKKLKQKIILEKG